MSNLVSSSDEMHDASGARRLRWTVIEVAVDDDNLSLPAGMHSIRPKSRLDKRVVVLRRLFKPMYNLTARVHESTFADGFVIMSASHPSVDGKIFVDMEDRTMWIEHIAPMPVDDFYKMRVSNDITADCSTLGYEIDTDPSMGLVPLCSLKETFVSWWCR